MPGTAIFDLYHLKVKWNIFSLSNEVPMLKLII